MLRFMMGFLMVLVRQPRPPRGFDDLLYLISGFLIIGVTIIYGLTLQAHYTRLPFAE